MARWWLIILPALLFFVTPAQAEVSCTGHDCSKINRDYGSYFHSFETNYIPLLTKDIIVAQGIAAAGGVPYHVNLNRFTIGAFGVAGVTQKTNVILQSQSTGEVKYIKEMGLAIQPNFYAGANLGWFINGLHSWLWCPVTGCSDELLPFLNNFDLYVYGIGNYRTAGQDDMKGSRRTFGARGAMLRYHVINTYTWHSFLQFSGLSLGGGVYESQQRIRSLFDDKLKLALTDYAVYEWSGKNKFEYYTKTHTSYADIRTGIRIFDAVAVYGGVGGSFTRGYSKIAFTRDAMIITPGYMTVYRINFDGQAENALKMPYGFVGVNLGPLTLQGTSSLKKNSLTNKRAYAGTIGLTFNF